MKKYLTGILPIFILAMLIATDAHAEREKRDVPTFTEVSLGVAADVYIKKGNTQSLELVGDKDDLEEIETEVVGGRLRIKRDNSWNWSWRSKRIDVYITMKDLEGLSVSGSGKIITEDKFTTGDLELDVSGSGKIEANVNADDVEIDISGSGSVYLKGESKSGSVDISGSGRMNALDHTGGSYDIRISGSGSCRINVVDAINANISGSGSVRYTGNPDKIRSKVSGSGSVKKMN